MTLIGFITWFAMAPPAQSGTQANPTALMLQQLGIFALIGVMFYLVLIRPQQKKAKEQAELLKGLRPGDKIVTNGGILGIVVSVKDKSVAIRSADTKLEVLKSAVTEITEKASGSAQS